MTLAPDVVATVFDVAASAAAAAAAVLPASDALTVGQPRTGGDDVTVSFAGAAVAELDGPVAGRIAVLVVQDLVDALAASPIGGLDLAAATQPALDALAASLGATAGAARTTGLDLVVADMGGPFTVVPLVGGAGDPAIHSAALLVSDVTLEAALAARQASPAAGAMPGQPVEDWSAQRLPPTPHGQGPTAPAGVSPRGIEMLHGVIMEVTVELGRTQMSVRDLLALTSGTVLKLDRAAGSPADLLVNGRLIARGEVVVVDEDFGLRVTEIVDDSVAG